MTEAQTPTNALRQLVLAHTESHMGAGQQTLLAFLAQTQHEWSQAQSEPPLPLAHSAVGAGQSAVSHPVPRTHCRAQGRLRNHH